MRVLLGIAYRFIRQDTLDSHHPLGYSTIRYGTSTRRIKRRGGTPDGVHAAEESIMLLVIAIAGLALFSVISIMLGSEDGREPSDPTQYISTWVKLGRR
jgi:hypothetical protein